MTKRKKRTSCPQPVKETLWRAYFGDMLAGNCYVCGKSIHFTEFEVGHNEPVVEGSTWDINNLRPLCRTCNRSMGTMTIEEFKNKYFPSVVPSISSLHEVAQAEKGTEAKSISTLSAEGEIPCIVVHPNKKHVQGINHILNPLKEFLPKKGFKPVFLSEEIKPLDHYGKSFEQLAEECALGIVILDGLRPNVLLEFGILIGKKKPIIPLQDRNAIVSVKSFYQQEHTKSNLTAKQFRDLKEPPLGFFSHISDLQGLDVKQINKDTSLENPEYPTKVLNKSIEKLWTKIIKEYNKRNLEQIGKVSTAYLQKFCEVTLKISEYYGEREEFSADNIETIVKKIRNLENMSRTKMPSQVYSTVASLYTSLADKTEWKNVPEIIDYYNQAIKICERILEFESVPALQSHTQRKIGDIYWELSQYLNKAENCKKAIKAYEEALKVYTLEMDYAMTKNNLGTAYRTLAEVEAKAENCKKAIKAYEEALKVYTFDRFPMDYAMTKNNLGTAYSTLAEVEVKAENCKKAIKAYEEALKVFTKEEFPEIYPLVEKNLRKLLNFCRDE